MNAMTAMAEALRAIPPVMVVVMMGLLRVALDSVVVNPFFFSKDQSC